jgi:histone deacetylase 6
MIDWELDDFAVRNVDNESKGVSIYLHPETYLCALLSCGGAIETCRAVMNGTVKNAIAVIRPPGHHAEPDLEEGFCIFNNVAVATRVIMKEFPETCKKVLILDW